MKDIERIIALPKKWDGDADLQKAAAAQAEKDFGLHGFAVKFFQVSKGYATLISELSEILDTLDFVHHPRFAALLYQLDLPEEKTGKTLRKASATSINSELAGLIIKRCFQKVYLRKHYIIGEVTSGT